MRPGLEAGAKGWVGAGVDEAVLAIVGYKLISHCLGIRFTTVHILLGERLLIYTIYAPSSARCAGN